jgi:hypothetical protein
MPFCILHRPTKLLVRLQDATKNRWDAKLAGEAEKPAFRIEPLGLKHDRAAFSCGVDLLDVYLRKQAGQDFKKHAAVPFVLTPDGSTIACYYTLSQYAVQLECPGRGRKEIAEVIPWCPQRSSGVWR